MLIVRLYFTLTPCLGSPGGASGREAACQCRRHKRRGFNPWVGKIPPEKEMATHSQYPRLGNATDRGAWWTVAHQAPLGFSSILAWRILEEPGGLQSMGLQRVRYDWWDLAHNPVPGTRGVEKCLLNKLKNKTMERNSTDDYKLQLDTKFPAVEYFSLLSLIYLG